MTAKALWEGRLKRTFWTDMNFAGCMDVSSVRDEIVPPRKSTTANLAEEAICARGGIGRCGTEQHDSI